jgi:hypothetical protein
MKNDQHILPTDLTFSEAKQLSEPGDYYSSRKATVYKLVGVESHSGDFMVFLGEEKVPVYVNFLENLNGPQYSYFFPLTKKQLRKNGHYLKVARYRFTEKKIEIFIR